MIERGGEPVKPPELAGHAKPLGRRVGRVTQAVLEIRDHSRERVELPDLDLVALADHRQLVAVEQAALARVLAQRPIDQPPLVVAVDLPGRRSCARGPAPRVPIGRRCRPTRLTLARCRHSIVEHRHHLSLRSHHARASPRSTRLFGALVCALRHVLAASRSISHRAIETSNRARTTNPRRDLASAWPLGSVGPSSLVKHILKKTTSRDLPAPLSVRKPDK